RSSRSTAVISVNDTGKAISAWISPCSAICLRSALSRVRWNDMPVRRMVSPVRCVDSRVRSWGRWTDARPGFASSSGGSGGRSACSNRLGPPGSAAGAPSDGCSRPPRIWSPPRGWCEPGRPAGSEPDRYAGDPPAGAGIVDEPIVLVLEVDVEVVVAGEHRGAGRDLVSGQSDELPGELGADAETAQIGAAVEPPAASQLGQRARADDRIDPQLARAQRQLGKDRVRGVEDDGRAQVPEPQAGHAGPPAGSR